VTLRWTIRALLCLALVACAASAEPQRTLRPNEVRVFEPAGQPDNWTFTPNTIAVAKGTTVTFVNRGKELHTVTSSDIGRPFDLSIDTNQTGSIAFDTVGTFAYHCGIHPQMKGAVRVCDGACP
jgi:plastocyanin